MKLRLITAALWLLAATCWRIDLNAQPVGVSADTGAVPEASFIGGSTEFLYPILRGVPNEDTTVYDTIYLSETALEALSQLNLNYLRFPGGTISQFYHYAGSNGYGTIDFDLDCRPGYINIPGFKQKVRVDKAYPGNIIEQYIDLHKRLELEQGNTVRTLYVINIMSHFFAGDLVPVNGVIDALVDNYGAGLGDLLDLPPNFLTDELIEPAVAAMLLAYTDPLIDQVKAFLVDQEDFQLRMAENIAAIYQLLTEGISVAGVELGNENYAFTMLKDDDLSEYPYDCTTPDSIVQQIGTVNLPLRAYMQAIIKYGIIASMYDTLVDELFDLPTGIVINSSQFNVRVLDIDQFSISENKDEKYRYHELWNRFIGQLDFYDGVIPHIYMRSQPECDIVSQLGADSLEIYGKAYIDYYFNTVLDYQLNRLLEETGNKPLWITEWNMNTANIFGNTFIHGSYVFQFMNELNRVYREYNVKLINFHNLAAWRYNQFALLLTDENTEQGYHVNLQSLYDPFLLMGGLHKSGHVFAETDLQAWLGDGFRSPPDLYFYSYYDIGNRRLILHFINQSDEAVQVPVSGTYFDVDLGSSLLANQAIMGFSLEMIDAASILSSNEGCEEHEDLFDDYTWSASSGDGQTAHISLPAYSLGRLTLDLQTAQPTSILPHKHLSFNIRPNPATEHIRVEYTYPGRDLSLSIHDITGARHISIGAVNGMQLDISRLPAGIYFIRLADHDLNTSAVKKLVVAGTR
jgi:hypothetical protein